MELYLSDGRWDRIETYLYRFVVKIHGGLGEVMVQSDGAHDSGSPEIFYFDVVPACTGCVLGWDLTGSVTVEPGTTSICTGSRPTLYFPHPQLSGGAGLLHRHLSVLDNSYSAATDIK